MSKKKLFNEDPQRFIFDDKSLKISSPKLLSPSNLSKSSNGSYLNVSDRPDFGKANNGEFVDLNSSFTTVLSTQDTADYDINSYSKQDYDLMRKWLVQEVEEIKAYYKQKIAELSEKELDLIKRNELLDEKEAELKKEALLIKDEKLKIIRQKECYQRVMNQRKEEQNKFKEQITNLLADIIAHKEINDERPITPISPYVRNWEEDYSPRKFSLSKSKSLLLENPLTPNRNASTTPDISISSAKGGWSSFQGDIFDSNIDQLQEQLKTLELQKAASGSNVDAFDVKINRLKTQISNEKSKKIISISNSKCNRVRRGMTFVEKYSDHLDATHAITKNTSTLYIDSPGQSDISFDEKASHSRSISPFNLDLSFDGVINDPNKTKVLTNLSISMLLPNKEEKTLDISTEKWKKKGWIAVPNVQSLIPKPPKKLTPLEEKQKVLDEEIEKHKKTISELKSKASQLELEGRDLRKKLNIYEDKEKKLDSYLKSLVQLVEMHIEFM
ncbi:unnamed protein product [Blepharisma stoltei]|uniref:Uncharacterized protein n=1 Tax=Blepharisma stoltei TaxID=1481888 RepID=A0AAU9J6L2_9CILI|nr:unnamed protein product [Blepharisma stoltei]